MSASLEKIMMLKEMLNKNQGESYGNVNPYDRRQAQGNMLLELAQQMRNPNIGGSGLDRMLNVANESMNGMDRIWNNSQEFSAIRNDKNLDLAMKLEKMEKDQEKANYDRAYDKRYLDILEGRSSKKKELKSDGKTAEMPEGVSGVPYSELTNNERNFATKQMHADLGEARTRTAAYRKLQEMRKLLEENPDMSEYMSGALMDPSKSGSFFETAKRKLFVNKKQADSIQKFTKLSNDLVLTFGEQFGKNFTDAKLRALEASKPYAFNTYEANKYVINNLLEDMSDGPEWEKALRYGLKNRVMIVRDPDSYKDLHRKNLEIPEEKENKGSFFNSGPSGSKETQSQSKTIRGIWKDKNGETEVEIPIEKANQFELDGGVIIGY